MKLLTARELAPCDDLDVARRILRAYEGHSAEQTATRERVLAFIDEHPRDAHRRTCLEGHLTASALVVDPSRTRGLLTFHKKLRRWLQLGGHCDGDANLAGVALRECTEESGIEGLAIDPTPIDVDVHWIPERPGEPGHWHFDTRFVVFAPEDARLAASEESIELAWWTKADLARFDTDESVRRLFALAFP